MDTGGCYVHFGLPVGENPTHNSCSNEIRRNEKKQTVQAGI